MGVVSASRASADDAKRDPGASADDGGALRDWREGCWARLGIGEARARRGPEEERARAKYKE